MYLVGEFAQKCRPYLFIIKRGRKFIDGPDTGYSISCQNKNKFLGFCKLSIIELKLLTGISLNTVQWWWLWWRWWWWRWWWIRRWRWKKVPIFAMISILGSGNDSHCHIQPNAYIAVSKVLKIFFPKTRTIFHVKLQDTKYKHTWLFMLIKHHPRMTL